MSRPIIKTIIIEVRAPQTEEERGCYGLTYDHGDTAKVFLDSRLSKSFAETFFHEMLHVFVNFSGGKKKIANEEKKCQALGKAARGLLYGKEK